jgi:hypothetical protein
MPRDTVIEAPENIGKAPNIYSKIIVVTYNILAFAAGFSLLIDLAKWSIALVLLYPLMGIAMVLVGKGAIRLVSANKKDINISVNLGIMIPIIFLLINSYEEYRLFQYHNIWLPVVVIGLIFLVVVYPTGVLKFAKGTSTDAIFMILFAIGYGYGGARAVNCAFDTSQPAIYKVEVLNMHAHHGRHDSYYAEITPWGPENYETFPEIDYDLYSQIKIGDTIQVNYRQGLFHVPWFVLTKN